MSEATTPSSDLDDLLQQGSFEARVFAGLDLHGLDLGGKELTSCTFRDCKAQETQWRGSRLEDCRFERCDLTRMQPRSMRALDVRFADCKLMGVEWTDLGKFPQLGFTDCVLDFASFVGLALRKVEFHRCKISEANFFDSDLREADFAGSDLRASIFRNCQLANTDFSAATGLFLDPAVNQARGARVPVETAVLLAMHHGLHVSGFTAPAPGQAATTPTRKVRSRRA